MESALTQLKRLFCCNRPTELKVVMLGLDNAGKTTLLYRLTNETVETLPTIGYNVEEIKWNNIKFLMWDIGGQSALRPSWSTYYANASAIIIVLDSTDESRFPVLKAELETILKNEHLADAAVLIFANKQDLPGAIKASDLSLKLGLTTIKHKWRMQPCSAVTGNGLTEGLNWISSEAK